MSMSYMVFYGRLEHAKGPSK